MSVYILVAAVVAIVVLTFTCIKLSFEKKLLSDLVKDKDAKYRSLLNYIETIKSATKPNKNSTKKS